jgi:hypothetical protein
MDEIEREQLDRTSQAICTEETRCIPLGFLFARMYDICCGDFGVADAEWARSTGIPDSSLQIILT